MHAYVPADSAEHILGGGKLLSRRWHTLGMVGTHTKPLEALHLDLVVGFFTLEAGVCRACERRVTLGGRWKNRERVAPHTVDVKVFTALALLLKKVIHKYQTTS